MRERRSRGSTRSGACGRVRKTGGPAAAAAMSSVDLCAPAIAVGSTRQPPLVAALALDDGPITSRDRARTDRYSGPNAPKKIPEP